MRRASAAFARGACLLALLALAACDGEPPAPPLPELLRLWRPPAGLTVSVSEPPPADAAPRVLCRTTFDGAGDLAWHALVNPPAGETTLRYAPVELNFGPVVMQRARAWAAVSSLPVAGGQAISVRVRARTSAPTPSAETSATPVPVAVLVELREPFDASAQLDAQGVADLRNPRRHASHVLSMEPSETARTLQVDFVTDRSTKVLQIGLVAPVGDSVSTIVVEEVEVQALPLAEHLARGGECPGLRRLEDARLPVVQVDMDRDVREGLLARPGRQLAFELPACAEQQRLELSFGVAPRDALLSGAVRLGVWLQRAGASNEPLVVVKRTAPSDAADPAWEDRSLELPPLPEGGTLSFTCEGEGEDPPLAVFGHPTVSRARAAPPPNVVIISLDTLRPDRLGCYGGDPALSPRLDALAAQGLRFARAYSTSSYTLPSHASLMTGQWPALHGAVGIADRLEPSRSPLLAQLLAKAGYTTAAFTGGGYVSPEYGFAEGFDRYASNDPVWALDSERGQTKLQTMSWERVPQQSALLQRYAAPAIEEWIARRPAGTPFFLFLHTYIVHNYAPDLAALRQHELLGPGGEQQPFNHQEHEAFNQGKLAGDEARERIAGQYLPYYDATISMADAFTGHVLDALEAAGLSERTIVMVVSDHGEEFGEHAFFGHGETLFEEVVRVPFIARLPAAGGPPPGSVAEQPVSLADIAPWVLRLCGLQPDVRMQVGAPLGPDVASPPGRTRVWMELDTHVARLSALRDGNLKLHVLLSGKSHGLPEDGKALYDVATGHETEELSAQRPDVLARLREDLDTYHAFTQAIHPRGAGGPLDLSRLSPQMIQILKALGYVK